LKSVRVLLLLSLALPGVAASTTLIDDDPMPSGVVSAAQAPIALLVDLSSGQTLYSLNGREGFLPASMTKAMTALVIFDLIKAGKLREDSNAIVRPATAARWAGKGTTLNLRGGEQVRLSDLLMGTTVVSANDASVTLAEAALGSTEAFVAAMNARAKALGMDSSHFGTPSGFPDRAVTAVTATDLVILANALIAEHPELYRRYIGKQAMDWRGARLISHDPFAGVLAGADGIKTGHTFEAGFNFLGTAVRDERRLVVVIGRSPTEPGRAAAAKNLMEWGFSAFESKPFLTPDWIVGAVAVQNGDAREVAVAVPRAYTIATRKGIRPQISARIVYNGPIRAPIGKGAIVGKLVVSGTGLPDHTIPLVATASVAKAGPIDRLINALLGLFG
jgi:serine-type D-Ala-D-Ala carboxypeptidase (penicillin-binding protein 5/6)